MIIISKKSTGAGIHKLSELEIDIDKDWAGHSIANLKGINYNGIFSINAWGMNYNLNGAVLGIAGDVGEMLWDFNQALMVNVPSLDLNIGGSHITFDYLGGDNVLNIVSSADINISGISTLESSSVMYIHTPQLWIQTDPAGWLRFRYDSNNNEIVIDKVLPLLINDQSGTGAWTRWRYDSANNEIVIESGLPVRIPNIVGAGIKKLSELEIDVSKDWGGFSINNISGISYGDWFNFSAVAVNLNIDGATGSIVHDNGGITIRAYQNLNLACGYNYTTWLSGTYVAVASDLYGEWTCNYDLHLNSNYGTINLFAPSGISLSVQNSFIDFILGGDVAHLHHYYNPTDDVIDIYADKPIRISGLIVGSGGITKLSQLEIDVDKDWNGKGIFNMSYLKISGFGQDIFRVENINDAEQHVVDSIYHDSTLNLDIVGTRWAMKVGTTDYHIGLGLTYDVTNNIMHSGLISYLNDFEIYGKYETGVGIYNYGIGISQEWFIYPIPFGDRYNFAFIYGIDELNQGYNGIFGIGFSSSRRAFTEQHLRYVFYEKKGGGNFEDVGMILLGDITDIGHYTWKLNTTEGMFFSTDHTVWLQGKEFMWLRLVDEATATEYGGLYTDYIDYGYGYTYLYGQYGYLEFTNTDINLYSDTLNFNVNVAGSISLSGSAIGITSTSGDITLNPASTHIRVPNGTLIGAINDSGDIYIVPNSVDWDAGVMIRGSTNPTNIPPYAYFYCGNAGISAEYGDYLVIYATPSGARAVDTNPGAITIDAEARVVINTPTLQFDALGGSGANTVFNSGGLQGFIFNSGQSITLNATNDIVLNPASGNLIVHGIFSGNNPYRILIGDTLSGNSEIDIFPDVNDWGVGIQMVNAINNPYINKRYMNIWGDAIYLSSNAGFIDMGSGISDSITIDASNVLYLNASLINIMSEVLVGATLYIQSIINMQNHDIININNLTGSAINISTSSGNITLNPASAVDFSQKQSKNHVLEKWTTSTRPSNPVEGQIGYNTDTHQFEGWNGSTWVILG